MKKIPYVYILSQRYSGSTLLSFLMGTHPDIATIGERRKFFTYSLAAGENPGQPCSCGKPFQECEHWSAIKAGMQQRINVADYGPNPTEYRLFGNRHLQRAGYKLLQFCLERNLGTPFSGKLKKLGDFNKVLVEEALKLDAGSAFLDSSKSIDQALFLSLQEAFDFRVIWLTRDPRAQVNSALKYNQWSVGEAAERWKQEMVENAKVLSALGIKHTVLNYEMLCRNPTAEMQRMLEFAGLDATKFSLDFREQTQHIMGNYSMRSGADTQIVERKEWQTDLSAADIATIEKATAQYREYYAPE